jgi:hypothetical protein
MSPNARPALRIGALLAIAAGCAWGAGQYADLRAFERRNPDAMALCGSLRPGMAVADAESLAHAVNGAMVATVKDHLVVRIPGERLCVAELASGRVRSAAVARNY